MEQNWLVVSKLASGIWQNLTRALESLKNFHFNGLLLSKVYMAWAKEVRRISLNWRRIKNLERNGLAVSKLTKEIWQIVTWALVCLKKVDFNGLLLSKVYIVLIKKEHRNNLSWNSRGIQNLERNRLVVSNWHKEFDKFWPKHLKVSKMFTLLGSCRAKYILFELKKNTETNVHETE